MDHGGDYFRLSAPSPGAPYIDMIEARSLTASFLNSSSGAAEVFLMMEARSVAHYYAANVPEPGALPMWLCGLLVAAGAAGWRARHRAAVALVP